jgi:hypothetical protein
MFIVGLASLAYANAAQADEIYAGCDQLNTGNIGNGEGVARCAATGGIDVERTVYGVEVRIGVNDSDGTNRWIIAGPNAYFDGVYESSALIPSGTTGYATFYFENPIVVSAGERPSIYLSSCENSACGFSTMSLVDSGAGGCGSGTCQYARWLWEPAPPVGDGIEDTHIIRIVEPAYQTTSISNNIVLSFDLYTKGFADRQSMAGYFITVQNANTGREVIPVDERVVFFPARYLSDGLYNYNTALELPNGSYSMGVQAFLCDFNETTLEEDCDLGYYGFGPSQFAHFSVVENTMVGDPVYDPNYVGTNPATCAMSFNDGFDLGSCMTYLFRPSQQSVQRFQSLTLANSFPFAYAYEAPELSNALFLSSSTASTSISVETPIGGMTFISQDLLTAVPFAALIKTLLTAVIWFMAAMVIYRRIMKVHDTNTAV